MTIPAQSGTSAEAAASNREAKLLNILRLPQVLDAVGVEKSTLYEMIANGAFPAPLPLHKRAVGWIEDEVIAWQQQRIAARNGG
jgi:prophage regulatory protein